MQRIDVTLVSGRRPLLLAKTLESFAASLFTHFQIANVFVNIDPFGGGMREHLECCELIRSYFPEAQISAPETPSFGRAVQSLWARTKSQFVFHMEDDWLLLEDVHPETVLPLLDGKTTAIKLLAKEHHWKGVSLFNTRRYKFKICGITVKKIVANQFGTSPAFFRGEFVRSCAALMDPGLDPEKQMSPKINRKLFDYQKDYLCRFLPGANAQVLVRDIGREWRADQGITKLVANGRSVWVSSETRP